MKSEEWYDSPRIRNKFEMRISIVTLIGVLLFGSKLNQSEGCFFFKNKVKERYKGIRTIKMNA